MPPPLPLLPAMFGTGGEGGFRTVIVAVPVALTSAAVFALLDLLAMPMRRRFGRWRRGTPRSGTPESGAGDLERFHGASGTVAQDPDTGDSPQS